ncbi:M15 family metallopeptidase [Mycolicibacterium aichiense]|uniref:D-alanyl-D-alanine carboxypeptidase n=1 Tax=Mycolicibacterium aichiense TaxID=1799 RepID=A0AAD1HI25_9MYCO|nr:M15 family metallopeptidase [Mycolicibacterium aichiense]MCV7020741.1 M15 family metallopeptidase [Mycolicibacterium aichiense]BBX05309.1 D-alanyl-D-alanine carboxypeptidase [Mycolicibacterium aichiense]STZ25340.1 peptidase M15B and M15C, D,D-carboxypeptidase VanY/endolysin [Mycolicibacterium aichiense]
MRVAATSVSAVVQGAATIAALLVGAVGVADPSPRIALADNTVSGDPPAVGAGDGSLADGQILTPFDVQNPAVGRLDPQLLTAIQQAASAASADGITMTITSGWRSPEFQQRLLDSAVAQYGSLAAAREYVQTPEASKHVVGEAVDVGGVGADQWLMANGARFGLCRIYANEVWHFELATDAVGNCPPLLPNAAG